jgi:hypothetical protein
MRLPSIHGVIRRRLLVNFRVDAEVMQRQLPQPLTVKRHDESAIAGVCLIRLEQLRPTFVPEPLGLASENAAHRVAVCWTDAEGSHEGVYIRRRDSDSLLSHLGGGRVFPGKHGLATFHVNDEGERIDFEMRSRDGEVHVRLKARTATELPATSRFASLEEASAFFEKGSHGYSDTNEPHRLDGIRLVTSGWCVAPLAVDTVYSSYFADETKFPKGSVEFDCALLMRNIPHEWQSLPDMLVRRDGVPDVRVSESVQ